MWCHLFAFLPDSGTVCDYSESLNHECVHPCIVCVFAYVCECVCVCVCVCATCSLLVIYFFLFFLSSFSPNVYSLVIVKNQTQFKQVNDCQWRSITNNVNALFVYFIIIYFQELQLQNDDFFYKNADLVGKVQLGIIWLFSFVFVFGGSCVCVCMRVCVCVCVCAHVRVFLPPPPPPPPTQCPLSITWFIPIFLTDQILN